MNTADSAVPLRRRPRGALPECHLGWSLGETCRVRRSGSSSAVAEMELELHDPVVLDREDRERRRALEAEVGEDDVRRAGHRDDRPGPLGLERDLDRLGHAVQGQIARRSRGHHDAIGRDRRQLDRSRQLERRGRERRGRDSLVAELPVAPGIVALEGREVRGDLDIDVPASVSEPVTFGVRPTAVLAPIPASCSFTR